MATSDRLTRAKQQVAAYIASTRGGHQPNLNELKIVGDGVNGTLVMCQGVEYTIDANGANASPTPAAKK